MSHLGDKVSEFVLGELSASEMTDAHQHLTACADCRMQVEQFQHIYGMLKASPDVHPPRNIVFEVEKPSVRRLWRWLTPLAAAALLLITIGLLGSVNVEWRDSQLTIAFGRNIPSGEPNQADLAMEIQRLQGHLAYLDARQQSVERDAIVTASTVQLLSRGQRSPLGD